MESPTFSSGTQQQESRGKTFMHGSVTTTMGLSQGFSSLRTELNDFAIKIATAGDKPASQVDPWIKELKVKKNRMKELQDLAGLTANLSLTSQGGHASSHQPAGHSYLVPDGIPYFQWDGMCLLRFEDVLQSHGLDFDAHWSRLLPRCLGTDLREWPNEYVKLTYGETLTWDVLFSYAIPLKSG
ncbi:hypothetical protein [Parasitella parasitica]|uniref:Uncharacterized protein n=1 Tax=Parasitella parasitica TaxID=35722 RepID=A0A0B7NL87_9FUNG|nr:hypothetical protein [Parasitella parasitica]